MTTRRVTSADGTQLAVYEAGSGPLVVAVHGYPDNHSVWDALAAELGVEFRVITYDVRGAGASAVPGSVRGYRIPHLVDDLVAVIDAVGAGQSVHLVGHDWGSVQTWPALTDPRLDGRITGFTSISGPSLDHAAAWLRNIRHDPRARLAQLAHSYYTLLFQIPRLPEAAINRGVLDRAVGRRDRSDAINGLNLYRANMFDRLRRPRPAMIDVPVTVIAPQDDPFVTPRFAAEAPAPFVRDLSTQVVPGGHWIVAKQPAAVAEQVRSSLAR
jgi:pimeloyl-ACP methyl ester carboxylesterase